MLVEEVLNALAKAPPCSACLGKFAQAFNSGTSLDSLLKEVHAYRAERFNLVHGPDGGVRFEGDEIQHHTAAWPGSLVDERKRPLTGIRIIKGEDVLSLYQFDTKEAKHYFCSVCGIYTHHKRRSNPNEYSINIGCLEGVNPYLLEKVPTYDGINHPSDQNAS